MKVHQFYYTSYGRSGYRIEASSIPNLDQNRSVEAAVQAAAVIWGNGSREEGTETVSYSEKAGSYLSAMTVSCRHPGDTRPGLWSHVILPEEDGSDGFAACLSWPLNAYQTEVNLGESLEDALLPEKVYDLQKICVKYGLQGERLAQLILLAVKSVSGACREAWLIHTEDTADDCCGSAREVMMLIYHLLPDAMRKKAGYQSPADQKNGNLRFLFSMPESRQEGFSLDPFAVVETDPDELAQEMGIRLAELFETNPKRYRQVIRRLCQNETDDFETILWNYFRQLGDKEISSLPQYILIGNASRLLEAAGQETGLGTFLEKWFAAVKMDTSDTRFAEFTELSLKEANLLKSIDKKTYRRCILRCRSLLEELSYDDKTFQENLQIISGQYPSVADDISRGAVGDDPEEEHPENPAVELPRKKRKKKTGIEYDDYSQRTVAFSFLFAGFYLALVMNCCQLAAELAEKHQNPVIFAGGIAAVIAVNVLIMLLNACIENRQTEHHISFSCRHHISFNGIFMAGVVLTVCAALAAIAGNAAAAVVSGVGTLVFGALLARR